jgi:dipeptidyl aminopeptidase/acylaminoacyl peptidase
MEKLMRDIRLSVGAAAILAAMAIAANPDCADAAEQTPLEVFGKLPGLEDVALSPDGTNLAYVKTTDDHRNLIIVQLGKTEILGGLRVGDAKLREIEWLDDDNVLATISSTSPPPFGFIGATREWYQLVDYNIPKKKLNTLTFDLDKIRTFNVVTGDTSIRDVAAHSRLFVPGYCINEGTQPCLFSVAFPDRYTRLVAQASEPDTDWLIDASGQIAAQLIYRDDKKTWELKTHKDGRWTLAGSGSASIDIPQMLGFSADGTSIIVRFVENGDPKWKLLNLKDSTWGEPLADEATYESVIEDRKSGRIVGGRDGIHYTFFDNEMQAHWSAVLRAFPNERVHLVSHSDDYSKMILKVFGAKDGYSYQLFEWYGHRATLLGAVYEGLSATSEVKAISYPAADGLKIPGILTLPRGAAAKNLPLIVMPHGGPEAKDTEDFDWWAQAYAAQGYAVLQPNFRGSTLNSQFVAAGFGEWGRKMQTDLSDGVRYLAGQGLIDPKRVCIVGASYGGYAALAGVTLESGVYRCAVSVAGIADIRQFRKWLKTGFLSRAYRNWDRFMGTADQNDPALTAISPIEHVQSVSVPVLLIHGKDDTVVPYDQSSDMQKALKRAGKPVELVTMKHEDHWLSHSETRLQMLQASMQFLKANNPPD